MTPAEETYYLPADRLADLTDAWPGGLRVMAEHAPETLPFAIRDCFDQSLRRSQRLLIETGGEVTLLTVGRAALHQKATPEARFVAGFLGGPVKAALADVSVLRALLVITSGQARLGRLSLIDSEGKTRVRAVLRRLEPTCGTPVVLITPQALRGYDRAYDELVSLIRGAGGVPLDGGNLYRMIDPQCLDYIAKPVIEVGRQETAFDVASDLIGAYIGVARANERGIIDDQDTEFLHDYRIALRKVRSVLSLFRDVFAPEQTAELKARFSALMEPTGALRDLDVYLLEQEDFYGLVPASLHDGLDRMFTHIRGERENAQARLANHLATGRYDKEITALDKLFTRRRKLTAGLNASRASYDFARELIWKRYRKICRIASAITDTTPDAEVHDLRIQCKKLRYLMEFFGPAFPKKDFEMILKPLKKLQDSLGLFNDYGIQQANLRAFIDRLDGEPRKLEIAQSVGALIAVLHQRQIAERAKITAAFAGFDSVRTQRTFRALFHDGEEF